MSWSVPMLAEADPVGGDGAQPSRIRSDPVPAISIHAFCETQETARTMRAAGEDRRFAKAQVVVGMGGAHAAAGHFKSSPTPNLIVVESMRSRADLLSELAQLADSCDAGTRVIVIGQINDVLLYRELLKRGVSEYLVAPVTTLQLLESISALYSDPRAKPIGRALAFIGAKGGAGSSVVCHNVAWTIAQQLALDVVIADFDLAFGTAALDFNQEPYRASPTRYRAPSGWTRCCSIVC